jgi:hypothetical protein
MHVSTSSEAVQKSNSPQRHREHRDCSCLSFSVFSVPLW